MAKGRILINLRTLLNLLMKRTTLFFALWGLMLILLVAPSCNQAKNKQAVVSADTSLMLPLNGVDQYVEIHGKSTKNPVLLFIHGGPAWPATPMIRSRNQNLFEDITVVCWDQRNCGKSKSDTLVPLNIDLYISDAHELTQFLKSRFHTDKIYIAGHSWGSVIGLNLARKYPEDYAAYIGMGQVINLKKGDQIARDRMCQLAKEAGDEGTVKAEEAIPFDSEKGYTGGWNDMIKHRILMVKYRINDHDTIYENQAIAKYDDYKALDWVGPVFRDGNKLFSALMGTDFTRVTEFKIPMYIMAGRYDYNTANPLVAEWFKTISAPKKEFFWFENSGHSPQWEEPERFGEAVRKIVRSTN